MRKAYRCRHGLLGFVCMVMLWSAQPGSALVISEVMYHPVEDAVTGDETLEFIELYNDRAVSEELGGWAFTNGIEYVFEPNTLLGPKQYFVIARDPNAMMAAYDINDLFGPFTGRLKNEGERVEFSNANGEIVLSIRYNDASPWPAAPDGAGHSLILAKLGGDPEQAGSWAASTYIGGTPGEADESQVVPEDPTLVMLIDIGDPGRYFKGTEEPSPGAGGQATITWTQIDFDDTPGATSWLEGPSGYGYSSDASELQYVGTQLNDMRGNYLSIYARLRFTLTAEEIVSFTQLLAEVHYDDAFVLYLNGIRIDDSGDISGDPPAFDQPASSAGEPPAATVDLTSRKDVLAVGTNVLAVQVHNANISSSSDSFVGVVLRGVIEQPHVADSPNVRILVNELLANSDAAPGKDWIELYNPGPTAVDLSHVYLSDDRLDLLQYKIPDGTVLPAGEFWAVREGTPPSGLPFGLDFSGETVYVTAATNDPQPEPIRILDAVRYGNMEPDMTFGRYPDGAASLDRLSAPTFGTPNAQRLVRDIVINEIMYQHATREEQFEYVELYNSGTSTVPLAGWAFNDGIDYTFPAGATMGPGSYVVVAKDPNFLAAVYDNLVIGTNLFGPYEGNLNDHSERIRLSYPREQVNPTTGQPQKYLFTADQVTYYDGGRWPKWADGKGASLELRDPRSHNDTPGAWADSDESAKTQWAQFSFTIQGSDGKYTHDTPSIFGFMLLNAGEVLLDDLELVYSGSNRLANSGFESGESPWRILGNHVRSLVTTEDRHSGLRSLHLIATGHGDPGANRINQSVSGTNAGTVTFRGWARWLRGSRFLLLRTTRSQQPVQPPRPSHAFELDMPLDLGTPGLQNTTFEANRGPDVVDVRHAPVLPIAGEPITVTARVTDNDGVASVTLYYRYEGGGAFTSTPMVDDGSGDDAVAGDGVYSAAILGSGGGMMRAFYIEASDGSASTRFPTMLEATAEVPERTCLIRVGDTLLNTRLATYRLWLSNDVVNTFRSRPNLSNELLDCTFVYNDREVFYNCGLRHRGSPWLRSGTGRSPSPGDARGYRIEFPPEQKFHGRGEINLDGTEGSGRGPIQERASYWFYQQLGLQYSRQEYVRLIMNGQTRNVYDDVQKIDGDYIDQWFPENNEGYVHKIDDYFEYSADGTGHRNLDEGLLYDSRHPLLPETYRWGFEKRSYRENDNWQHLFDFAVAMNTSSSSSRYEQMIESVIDPVHFAKVLAIRHAVGDWDSYGYERGKNNYFYYALPEGKWYLLPWDIDFALGGSSRGSSSDLFAVGGHFPEVRQFLDYPKYKLMYYDALAELASGPWQTSYGTTDPPTAFDRFVDEAADVLSAEGLGDGRRNGIKQYVRDRRNYILSRIPDPPPSRPMGQ